jgi:glycine/D-amino acid oxidase-like deaminating enzyme
VIGAGVVGCSIAYHLARAGAAVTVFDKGDICAGMSARSGALVRMHYTFAPEAELAWKSLAYFENWREMIGAGDCGLVRTGFAVIVGPDNADKLRANVAVMHGLGVDTAILDPQQLRSLDASVAVGDVTLAAYEPRSGYADPIATTRSFAEAAMRQRARFMLHNSVASVNIRSGSATGIRTTAGQELDADAVCVVAGPWTDRLLEPLEVHIGIKPERAQVAFFQRDVAVSHLAYIDTISGSYFRPHGAALTMAGLGEWRQEEMPDPDGFRETNDADFIEEVRRRLARRIPAMGAAPYAYGHAGIYDISPDARAVMGRVPGFDGLYVAAGFSGTGFKTSPAVGAAMSELILTGAGRTVDLSPFGFERLLSGKLIESPTEYAMGAGFGHKL